MGRVITNIFTKEHKPPANMRAALTSAVLIIHCSCQLVYGANQQTGMTIRFEKFEQCSDKLDMPNLFLQTRAAKKGINEISIEGTFMIRRAIVEPATLKVVFYKCASKDAPNTCEYYYTYTNNNFCKMVGMDNMPWSDLWMQTTLPRSCPINVGNYSINGAKWAMGSSPRIPLLMGYWKIRSTGKTAGKSWHCAEVEFSFSAPVKRNRKRGKQPS